jgi:DNA-binding XRE family transcriptional regulator
MVSDPLSELGLRLRDARVAAGLTQVQLADKLGQSFSDVRRYERELGRVQNPAYAPSRRRAPSWLAKQVALWAEATEADAKWLLFGEQTG